jgi:hypothetical protein
VLVLHAAGRRRSAATMPGSRRSRAPATKGQFYPADPPTVEKIVAVMCQDPPMIATALGCGRSSSCSGMAGCASRRRSRWESATSICGGVAARRV